MPATFSIEKLGRQHRIDAFDCGIETLNRFLIRHAFNSQLSHASQTYVALRDGSVVGYHTLTVGEIIHAAAPERMTKGLARHPVPIMILARLAVHKDWQGKGLGGGLLKDAILRTLAAADIAGIRALVFHAKDDVARNYYQHFGFADGLADPLHLYLLTKDLKLLLA